MDEPHAPLRRLDLPRIVLGVMTIGGLTLASFWVLKPFLLAGIWATMIVVATWPALRALQARLWGRRSLAVAGMVLVFFLIVAAPLATAVVAIVDRTDDIIAWAQSLTTISVAHPPEWLQRIPLVGPKITERWRATASASSEDLFTQASPYLKEVARWLLGQAGTFGALLVHVLLAMIIAAILYAKGEMAAAGVLAFARRLGGEPGVRVALLSAQAIRAVALGIVVTALIQSIIGGIGLVITGVPYPLLLTSVMFMFGVAQIGAVPVLVGAVVWVYWSSGTFWGTVMLVWTIFAGSLDNVLRPILIRRGADVPFLLILAGVIGGLLAFGLVGLFVGPVVLSVTYTLLEAWVRDETHSTAPAAARVDAGGTADS